MTYDAPIGILPVASMEDFRFLGWYTQPYSQTYLEGIMHGDAIPSDNQQLKSDDVYVTAGETEIYAYLVLQYEELEHGLNRRPGADGYMGTNDDNYYVNGEDGIAGTHDDEKLYPGEDGKYGTDDDYYLDDEDRKIYPGNDGILGQRMIIGITAMGRIHVQEQTAALGQRMILKYQMALMVFPEL